VLNGEPSRAADGASVQRIGVVLVEPDPIARDVLYRVLSASDALRVSACHLGEAEGSRIPAGTSVLVIAVKSPSDADLGRLGRLIDPARLLVLGTEWTRQALVQAFEAGAAGCMIKNADTSGLVSAIEAIASGHIVMSPGLLKIYSARARPSTSRANDRPLEDILTAREIEILSLLCEGMTTEEIARRLVVTLPTVKSHVSHLLAKLGVKNRVQAVLVGKEYGLDGGAGPQASRGRGDSPAQGFRYEDA
jgi:two-component system, NarL family, nitrate/nitrite response regulator NarL